jgi:hypothetical protein
MQSAATRLANGDDKTIDDGGDVNEVAEHDKEEDRSQVKCEHLRKQEETEGQRTNNGNNVTKNRRRKARQEEVE